MNVNEKTKKTSNITNYTPQQKNKTASKSISHTVKTKQTSPKGLKRKHNELESRKEEILTQLKFLKNKIDDIYDKFVNQLSGEDWREELKFELKQENILEISDNFPKSLNTKGSHFLEYTKFWILFIELKYSNLDLLEIVSVFNNALQYDQNDVILLYEYMVNLFFDNFDKEEILIALEKVNGKGNKHRVPEKAEEITSDHIKFLVNKPEIFTLAKTFLIKNNFSNGKNCTSVNKNITSPMSSQTKQKFNPHTYSKSIILNKEEENKSPISIFNVFEGSFNKKHQIEENLVISSNKNNFSSTKQIKHFNEISTQTENLKNDPLVINQSFAVNTSIVIPESQETSEKNQLKFDKENSNTKNLCENEMKYSDILRRNKFDLEISRTVDIKLDFISDVKNVVTLSTNMRKSLSHNELPQIKTLNSIEEENLSTLIEDEQIAEYSTGLDIIPKKSKTKKRGKSTRIKSSKK
jgi:hypothetical protein